MTSTSPKKVDLTNCDREPIHIPSSVQSFGCLIAVSPDWLITHASSNSPAFFDVAAEDVIGTPLAALVDAELIHDLRSKLQFLSHADAVERLFGKAVRAGRPPFDIAIHRSEDTIVLEFERTDPEDRTDYTSYIRPMLDRLRKADTIEAFCALAARQMQVLTGFDRVMVYRFAPNDCGEVIAEAGRPDMETFLGLHYPASDIPAQARALYRRNLLRIISDIRAETAAVIPRLSPEGRPLDLSMSALRAVSPIHLEYLRNMGVAASMSISILTRGRLWGLFACHHPEPRVLSYKLRSAIELFGQLFAFLLDQKEGDLQRVEAEHAQKLHDQLMAQFADDGSIAENFDLITEAIGESIPSDGVVSWIDGSFKSHGRTPTREEFLGLARFLNTTAGRIFAHDRLGEIYPSASDFADRSVGLLALPMSRSPRDYLVLFRQEMARSVRWAGNPQKPATKTSGPNGDRLTPRKSFKAWQELVRGQSAPWAEAEIRAAEALRMTLLEVVLRLTDTANREREIAQNRQELLIAELNHRVRNILNLIRGLISQSGADVEKVSDFTGIMGGRIDALARAHDLITRENWNSASFRELIETEIGAYLGEKADRVVMTGPDVLLEPQAFSTVALVMHELITNSAKYGALSDRHGQISIDVVDEPDGALALRWRESGGPPVKAPTRRGFGSTIIERSIPYELKGETKVRFEVTGLQATFRLPARHVASFKSVSDQPARQQDDQMETATKPITGNVLVVEDNLIIAMDAEDIFTELGAGKVTIAGSVAQAERLIADETFALAILDVNLGDETSESVAKTLIAKNIPVIFATGYGEHASITEAFPKAPVLQKPYGRKEARAVLAALPL